VFALPRPPESLTEHEARELAGAARPLGDLHALWWERDDAPADRKRGSYARRGGARLPGRIRHADRT
jgi:hypothetical protein